MICDIDYYAYLDGYNRSIQFEVATAEFGPAAVGLASWQMSMCRQMWRRP